MTTKIEHKTLRQYREEIAIVKARGGPNVYAIIGAKLRLIAQEYGTAAADEAILDLDLGTVGWRITRK
jgi:hypothetical protein